MNKSNTTLATKKGMSSLSRPKFAPGMLLQHDDLEQLNHYTRELNRLMFRSLFGCGVMCGLVVKTDMDCGSLRITVEPGVALSCTGDPIEIQNPVQVLIDKDCHPGMADTLWVRLCGTTKCCAPRTSMCESDDDETKSECTRERDGYEILVDTARPPCVCGCPEPKKDLADTPTKDTSGQGGGAAGTGTDPASRQTRTTADAGDCKCVDPNNPCYADHYKGYCGCHCADCDDCDCKCILLARLDFNATATKWTADHSVRRFIRPVLMRDYQVEVEQNEKKQGGGEKPMPTPTPTPSPTPSPAPPEPAPTPAPETAEAEDSEAARTTGKGAKKK
jgi:hypothetical protein